MATIKAKRIQDALEKAKKVGLVEEEVSIADCPLVLQSLEPSAYEAIMAECEDLPDLAYLHAYQIGHLARSIVEINGQDLRGVDFIEDEVPAGVWGLAAHLPTEAVAKEVAEAIGQAGGKATVLPPDGSETRVIQTEKHEWLRDNVISTWSREAIVVGWRKFSEVVIKADEKAKEGIKFMIPDETPEEKFRRLANEMKEVEDDLPPEIVSKVLSEIGFVVSSSDAEVAAATRKLADLAKEEADQLEAPEAPSEPEAAPTPQPPAPVPQAPPAPPQAQPAPVESSPSPEDLMLRRTPLNQQAIQAPVPAPSREDRRTVSASPRAAVPPQIRQAAVANAESMSRADRIAALETNVDPSLQAAVQQAALTQQLGEEAPLLEKRTQGLDGKALAGAVDRPPAAGINPRYKPQQR